MSTSTVAFIYTWQTLIGAALGPFLAIMLSLVGFWLKNIYESRKERKESIRITEVSITRSINDLFSTRKKLEDFSRRLRELASEARAITDDRTYFLERTNYPAVKEIFFNAELPNLKFGSTYLHNKLMFTDAGLKETNSWLHKMEKDFDTMTTKNEFLMGLSPRPLPKDQRAGYAENLELFADATDEFQRSIMNGVKTATQIKIYNLKMMKGRLKTIQAYEGSTLKYFKNRDALNEYKKWSKVIDRIDAQVEAEVKTSLAEMEKGYKALPKS